MKNEILKEHFINPVEMGSLDKPDYKILQASELCSDVIKLTMNVSEKIVTDIMAEVNGCGFSTAGASLFIKNVKGKNIDEVPVIMGEIYGKISPDIEEKSMECVKLAYYGFMKIYQDIKEK